MFISWLNALCQIALNERNLNPYWDSPCPNWLVLAETFFEKKKKNPGCPVSWLLGPETAFPVFTSYFHCCHGNSLCCTLLTSGGSCASVMAPEILAEMDILSRALMNTDFFYLLCSIGFGRRVGGWIFHIQTTANPHRCSPVCLLSDFIPSTCCVWSF